MKKLLLLSLFAAMPVIAGQPMFSEDPDEEQRTILKYEYKEKLREHGKLLGPWKSDCVTESQRSGTFCEQLLAHINQSKKELVNLENEIDRLKAVIKNKSKKN